MNIMRNYLLLSNSKHYPFAAPTCKLNSADGVTPAAPMQGICFKDDDRRPPLVAGGARRRSHELRACA